MVGTIVRMVQGRQTGKYADELQIYEYRVISVLTREQLCKVNYRYFIYLLQVSTMMTLFNTIACSLEPKSLGLRLNCDIGHVHK